MRSVPYWALNEADLREGWPILKYGAIFFGASVKPVTELLIHTLLRAGMKQNEW